MDGLGDSTTRTPLRVVRQVDEISDAFDMHLAAGKPAVLEPFIARIDLEGRPRLISELVGIAIERLVYIGELFRDKCAICGTL